MTTEAQQERLDVNNKPIRVGDVVYRTLIFFHVERIYTMPQQGKVMAYADDGTSIIVQMSRAHTWSLPKIEPKAWNIVTDSKAWAIISREGLS